VQTELGSKTIADKQIKVIILGPIFFAENLVLQKDSHHPNHLRVKTSSLLTHIFFNNLPINVTAKSYPSIKSQGHYSVIRDLGTNETTRHSGKAGIKENPFDSNGNLAGSFRVGSEFIILETETIQKGTSTIKFVYQIQSAQQNKIVFKKTAQSVTGTADWSNGDSSILTCSLENNSLRCVESDVSKTLAGSNSNRTGAELCFIAESKRGESRLVASQSTLGTFTFALTLDQVESEEYGWTDSGKISCNLQGIIGDGKVEIVQMRSADAPVQTAYPFFTAPGSANLIFNGLRATLINGSIVWERTQELLGFQY
jgi:hypothetical protein